MLDQATMREATRLTQAGRLVEATALLQRMLRGEQAPPTTSPGTFRTDPPRLEPPTIELQAVVSKVTNKGRVDPRRVNSAPQVKRRAPSSRVAGVSLDLLRGRSGRAPSMTEIIPTGTQFIEESFTNASDSRSYKLFIPSRAHGQPRPLIVMLHGCTQSPDDFAAGTRMNFAAEEHNCFVAYPEQPRAANQAKCWNWFRTADQQRGAGEPALIAGITRQIMKTYDIDPKRIYVAGLSAGGAAAAILGETYPDLYAAIGIHSGLACGAANDLPSAFAAMRQGNSSAAKSRHLVPIIVFHGDRDTTVHPQNGDRILNDKEIAQSASKKVSRGQVPAGHSYTRTVLNDVEGRYTSEHWSVHGAAHAWSGGSSAGSYTDPRGPDATREMLRFFLEQRLTA
jgi:poly(hydroxyalkanoate) depolymerase family esterase